MYSRTLATIWISACACRAPAQMWTVVRLQPSGAQFSQVYAVTATQQGGFARFLSQFADPPLLWSGSSTAWLSLTPSNEPGTVQGMWGNVQVGEISGHAFLWTGTPQSRVALHPPSVQGGSVALAVRGNLQVGTIALPGGGNNRACLWRGTAASYIDLHPAGAIRSIATATDGFFQGGYADRPSRHAIIWNGTAESFIDLHPAGSTSVIWGMAPGVQVGQVNFPSGGGVRAALWRGTAASWVDMYRPGGAKAFYATTGSIHVGIGGAAALAHAVINFGDPEVTLDLHQFLPPQYQSFSQANAVYQDGETIYVGGYADAVDQEAILWIGRIPCYANCDFSSAAPSLNVNDFMCFINTFAAGNPAANCDQSIAAPTLNVLDFACFLGRFAAGCS